MQASMLGGRNEKMYELRIREGYRALTELNFNKDFEEPGFERTEMWKMDIS